MPTFEKCDLSVAAMAKELLDQFETHHAVRDAGVTIDFVFAYANQDEAGNPVGNALTKNGCKCGGLCRKMPLKDRALGRADVEIALDGDWWRDATDDERRALLDHELHHIAVKIGKTGLVRDDLGRPVVLMRKHDYDFGWFKVIAARHGKHSQERYQATEMMNISGQYFWPAIAEGRA